MGDWWTVLGVLVAAAGLLGLGWLIGAEQGYRRGWLFGEQQARRRTLQQIELLERRVEMARAHEKAMTERLYAPSGD